MANPRLLPYSSLSSLSMNYSNRNNPIASDSQWNNNKESNVNTNDITTEYDNTKVNISYLFSRKLV
jgi:hypothetical protein